MWRSSTSRHSSTGCARSLATSAAVSGATAVTADSASQQSAAGTGVATGFVAPLRGWPPFPQGVDWFLLAGLAAYSGAGGTLNATLTVRAGQAASHQGKGWELFTDEVLRAVNAKQHRVVFLLWGASARKKAALVDRSRHVVIESAHPSPLSAHNGFFGSRPFSRTNAALVEAGLEPIDWAIPPLQ